MPEQGTANHAGHGGRIAVVTAASSGIGLGGIVKLIGMGAAGVAVIY